MDPSAPAAISLDRRSARIAGAVATCVALAILWAISGIVHAVAFPPTAIAGAVVRATPGGIATFFIDLLRHWALRLLALAVLLVTVGVGAYTPIWTSRSGRIRPVVAGVVLFVLAGASAVIAPGETNVLATIAAVAIATLAYIATMSRLYARAVVPHRTDEQRRRILRMGAVGGLGAAVGGGIIGWAARRLMGPDRDVFLATPTRRATPPERASFPDIPGQSPEITPVDRHYVVDIDLVSPLVEAKGWTV
ncbi:MAG TPA: hypothetical protein VFK89_02610, partial [Actinomycetota bacterium]|nr:hypothetical protein [Actinomycetota bacterium]